jgi:hypothetical protein
MTKVTLNGKESEITVALRTPPVAFEPGKPSLSTPGLSLFRRPGPLAKQNSTRPVATNGSIEGAIGSNHMTRSEVERLFVRLQGLADGQHLWMTKTQ